MNIRCQLEGLEKSGVLSSIQIGLSKLNGELDSNIRRVISEILYTYIRVNITFFFFFN
jgi:hypothetical protein